MAKKITFVVTDPVGLYATPATELVDSMKLFASDISLTYEAKTVNMKSLMGVLSLGIPNKAKIIVEANGNDEEAAIDRAKELIISLGISDNV